MQAPPYSPTAASSERRLPDDFRAGQISGECEDPLESLRRRQSVQVPTSPRTARLRHASLASTSSTSSGTCALEPVATAPASTTPFPFHAPFASAFELPPGYAPVDELARSFRLEAPFVYTTKTSNLPRYQLMQEFTPRGKPRKLSIRRLMPRETRSHSLPDSELSSPKAPRIRFDEDATMYSTYCYELPGSVYQAKEYEMRGHRSSTLGGTIKLEAGKSLLGGRWIKAWHATKNARKDSLSPENEARMQKYGYHAEDEWDRRLLFCVKKGTWEDADGREVAWETGPGEFEVCEAVGREGWRRDLAVSCWVMKVWMAEGLRWENDVKGW